MFVHMSMHMSYTGVRTDGDLTTVRLHAARDTPLHTARVYTFYVHICKTHLYTHVYMHVYAQA